MKIKSLLWPILLGTICCVTIAGMLFGFQWHDVNRPPFYFLMLGFAGYLSLALFRAGRARDVIYINILIYIVFAIYAQALKPVTSYILIIYYTALVLSLFLYVKYYDKKLSGIKMAGPLVLLSMIGLFYIAASLVHNLFFITRFTIENLVFNMPIGFLIGLGIVSGSEIARLIHNKYNTKPA